MPTLALILCTRNDTYMGNARWRLQTVLNRTADAIDRSGHLADVRIVVSDWGSEEPLADVLHLSATAKRIVQFLHVPPPLATVHQKDSPFPEVLALNAAVRRCTQDFIGRIDNDTVVGAAFFRRFFAFAERSAAARRSYLFIQRRCVPYEFASRSPSQRAVRWLTGGFGRLLPVERINKPNQFFQSPVGIMILHRDIWAVSGGYDETLLYWGWMECDLAFRVMPLFPAIDLGPRIGRAFFHLEHYDGKKRSTVGRKSNPMRRDNVLHPNDADWGLADVRLSLSDSTCSQEEAPSVESIGETFRQLWLGLKPLLRLNIKWLSRDWPFSLILFEPRTGHLRRRFRAPRPVAA